MSRTARITAAERMEIRRRSAGGEHPADVAVAVGRTIWSVHRVLRQAGGMPPRIISRSALRLTLAEREEVSRGLLASESLRSIARRLDRARSEERRAGK